ncbi:MAG TPA: leucine-rich repeat domain-containing protein, partial [Paludibacter sp.]
MKTNLQLASKKGTLCVVLFVLFFLFSFSIRAQMPAIENLTPPHKPLILPIKNALPNRASRTEANTVESKTVNVTAGNLYSAFTSDERATVTDLTVTGTIDARDFATMRDSMPELAVLNISGATITAYSGTSGTAGNTSLDYPANTIPDYAFVLFNSSSDYYAKTTLISVQLPLTATAVGRLAFLFCYNLNSITIPNSVTHIGQGSFEYCYGINAVSIPASVANIDASAFFGCNGYVTVDLNNPNFSSLNGSLFNKNQTTLIHVPYYTAGSYTIPSTVTSIIKGAFGVCEFLTSVTIPSSVTFIDNNAFRYCYNLTSLSIPASVTVIGDYAFGNCSNLASFNVYSATPVNLSASINAFYGVNTDTCLLRVPAGAENAYKSATLWENFVYLSSITSKSVN